MQQNGNEYQKQRRNLTALTGAVAGQNSESQEDVTKTSATENEWKTTKKSKDELTRLGGLGGLSDKSNVGSSNLAYIEELWILPTQARLNYEKDYILDLAEQFVSDPDKNGQIEPISVILDINPDNPKQHLRVKVGHNRFKAWQEVFSNPKYAHLTSNKAWVDKHRPLVCLSTETDELDLLAIQCKENNTRSNLTAFENCVNACKYIVGFRQKTGKQLNATEVTRLLGVRKDEKKFPNVVNDMLKMDEKYHLINDIEFLTHFAAYRVDAIRLIKTFLKTLDAAIQRNMVSTPLEWSEYIGRTKFPFVLKDSARKAAIELIKLFDDLVPDYDEIGGDAELQRRYDEAQPKKEPKVEKTPVVESPVAAPMAADGATYNPTAVQAAQPVTQVATAQPATTAAPSAVVEPTHTGATTNTAADDEEVRHASIQAGSMEEDAQDEVPAPPKYTKDTLFQLLIDGSNEQIGKHFKEILNSATNEEVSVFMKFFHDRLGDDFIEATNKHLY